MLPAKWGKHAQSEVVKQLGFDAESPMVRTEISQILSSGSLMDNSTGIEGYSEQTVQLENAASTATVSPAQLRQLATSESESEKAGFAVGGIALVISD